MGEVLRGWCDSLSTPRPLGPWRDIAAGLGARVHAEFERTDGGAGGVSGLFRVVLESLTPGVTRAVGLRGSALGRFAASLDLLRLLARRIEQFPILLVASYRDDEIRGRAIRSGFCLATLPVCPRYAGARCGPLSPEGVASCRRGAVWISTSLYRVTGATRSRDRGIGYRRARDPRDGGDAMAGRLGKVSPAHDAPPRSWRYWVRCAGSGRLRPG